MKGLWDYLVYGIVVAGILVLTRPGSQGPAFVRALGGATVNFAQAVSGQRPTKF